MTAVAANNPVERIAFALATEPGLVLTHPGLRGYVQALAADATMMLAPAQWIASPAGQADEFVAQLADPRLEGIGAVPLAGESASDYLARYHNDPRITHMTAPVGSEEWRVRVTKRVDTDAAVWALMDDLVADRVHGTERLVETVMVTQYLLRSAAEKMWHGLWRLACH
jgi:hypothetical protein